MLGDQGDGQNIEKIILEQDLKNSNRIFQFGEKASQTEKRVNVKRLPIMTKDQQGIQVGKFASQEGNQERRPEHWGTGRLL
jgi:hypothetical protein